MKYAQKLILLLLILLLNFTIKSYGQSGNCDNNTPFFDVDLSGAPDSSWFSPNVSRSGKCCGETGPPPPRCIEFEITLDDDAVGILFDIYSGAVPSGSMYYHIDCGPSIKVGEPICLQGSGPFTLTFCKPGNNPNVYSVTSINGNVEAHDTFTVEGCSIPLLVDGISLDGIEWRDITGGGIYNGNLSCTTQCLSPTFTAPFGVSEIEYEVCGIASAEACADYSIQVCDTLTIRIDTLFDASILVENHVCPEKRTLIAEKTVYSSTYTYNWYNNLDGQGSTISTDSFVYVGSGDYSVIITDIFLW